MITLNFDGLCDQGRVRKRNEDNWSAWPEKGIFVVSDGMGHASGLTASTIVVQTLPRLLVQRLGHVKDLKTSDVARALTTTVVDLSTRVREASRQQVGLASMGATVVVALIREGQARVAHLGDSRAYLLRRLCLQRLTVDHSVTQLLVATGEISRKEAAEHPSRGRLTQYVGMEGEVLPETQWMVLSPGDRLLLCSNGLTDMVPDRQIAALLLTHETPDTACHALVEAANAAGGSDNITALVINYQD
jgi:serine/threonine protein phosphatase PrpC